MANVRPLYVASNRASPTAVLDSDTILVGGIESGSGGGAVGIYDDAFTTSITIGGGVSQTTMSLGKTGQTATFLGSVTVTENLTVSGTTTTLDTTNLSISDDLIVLRGDASGVAADEAGIVFERGTTSANDAIVLWNEANTRFELGVFASSNGTVSPTGAITSGNLTPLRMGDTLTLDDGGVGSALINTTSGDTLTVRSTDAALTAGTVGSFAFNMQTDSTTRWTISSTGHLIAGADNVYDIGTSGTDSPRTIRADTSMIAAVGGGSPITLSSGSISAGAALTVAATGSNTVSLTGFGTTYGLNAGAVALSTTAQTIVESINEIYAGLGTVVVTLQEAYEAGNTITTDAGNGAFDVSGTEAISLDTTGLASNFNIAANSASDATLTIGAANAGAGAANIDIDAKSAFTVDAGSFSLDATNGSNVTVTGNDLTVRTTTSGSLILTGAGLVDINAGAALDIDVTTGSATLDVAAGGFFVTASSTVSTTSTSLLMDTTAGFSIDGNTSSNVSVTGSDLQISTITSGELDLTSAGLMDINAATGIDIDITSGSFDVLASGAFSIDGTGASNVSATSGDLIISTITSGELDLTAAGLMDVNAGANLDVDVTGTIDILATSTFSIDGTGSSNVTASSGNLTLSTLTSGNVVINSVAIVDIDGSSVLVDSTSGISLDAVAASNFTVSGATADLTLGARGTTITLNESGEESLDGGFTATSIVGALNELYGVVATPVSLQGAYENGNTIVTAVAEGAFDVSGTEEISLDTTGLAANFNIAANSASAATLVIGAANAGAGAGNIDIDAKSAVTVDAGTFSIDATGASNVTVTNAHLTLSTSASGNIIVNASSGIDMDAAESATIDAGSFSIDSTGASNVSVTGDSLTISTLTSGALILTSADLMDVNAGANLDIDVTGTFDMLSTGAFSIDGTGASNITTTSGNLTVSTVTGGVLVLTGAADVDVNAGTDFVVDAARSFSIDATPTSSVNANITLAANSTGTHLFSIQAVNSGSGSASLDFDAKSGVTIDVTAGNISLDCTTASNFTVSGATADLTLGARGATITLNESGNTTLDADFTATSIVGALNELLTYGTQVNLTAGAGGISAGRLVYISAANTVLHADASAESTAQVIGFAPNAINAAAQGKIQLAGVGSVFVQPGEGSLAANDVLFLSETAGAATKTAPETSGSVRQVIGYVLDPTGYDDTNGSVQSIVYFIGPRFINP